MKMLLGNVELECVEAFALGTICWNEPAFIEVVFPS